MARFDKLMTLAATHAWMTTPVHSRAIALLIASVPTRGSAVDIGCGGAVFARRFREHGLSTLALDSSRAVCDALRRVTDNLDIQCAEAKYYEGPKSFDVISCFGVELSESFAEHLNILRSWGHTGTHILAGDWVPESDEDKYINAYDEAGIRIVKRHVVEEADWVDFEIQLVRKIKAKAPGTVLHRKMEDYLQDVLPELVREQHFSITYGVIGEV